jgi:hypothetical protein
MTIMARFRSDAPRSELFRAIEWLENACDTTRDFRIKVRALGSDPRDRMLPRFTHEITISIVTVESTTVDNAALVHQLVKPLLPILENYIVMDRDDP